VEANTGMLGDKVLSGAQIGGESYAAVIGVLAMTCEMDMELPAPSSERSGPSEERYKRILQEFIAGNLSIGQAARLLRNSATVAKSS